MLNTVFYWLLNMSIIGTLTGFIVLIIRKIKSIPRFVICILWIIPFIRLIIPIGISEKYSFMNFISKYSEKTVVKTIKIYKQFSMTNSLKLTESYIPFKYKTNLLENIFNIASFTWFCIMILFIITVIIMYISAKRNISDSQHLYSNIYISNKINTPAVYGIIKPKIVLLKEPELQFDYILLHEKAHIKRHDNLWRMIAIVTACIHWFNPFVWMFLKCFLIDIEMACDEKVIKNFDKNMKKEYSFTLLSTAQNNNIFISSFGGSKLKNRIKNIFSYKKITLFSAIAFSLFIIAISYILLTNASI